jgi:hypothetical protein
VSTQYAIRRVRTSNSWTLRVELRDAVGLDIAFAGEPELLLDSELDGQAVAVPASLAGDVPALHRLEPGEQVLEHARLDVVRSRLAVGGGRAFVEHPGLTVLGLLKAALEDLVALPAREDLVLERGQVDLGGELLQVRQVAVRHVVVLRRCRSTEGRDPFGPAVPPSLGPALASPLLACVSLRG